MWARALLECKHSTKISLKLVAYFWFGGYFNIFFTWYFWKSLGVRLTVFLQRYSSEILSVYRQCTILTICERALNLNEKFLRYRIMKFFLIFKKFQIFQIFKLSYLPNYNSYEKNKGIFGISINIPFRKMVTWDQLGQSNFSIFFDFWKVVRFR